MTRFASVLKAAAVAAAMLAAGPALSEETEVEILKFNAQTYMKEPPVKSQFDNTGYFKLPTRPKADTRKNTMMPPISAEAKMRAVQSGMMVNPFSLRDMMNFMVAKKKVLPGISFDEVVESLKTKANELNMRAVGHNTPYKLLRQIDDPGSPRVEILSFCDLITMRRILDYSLEFLAFLPCKISVAEDADGQIWLVTLDWDVRWLDTSPNPNKIPDDLRKRAISVRERIEAIMEAAAIGDF
ncbi:MAG: DUF302 domain-containing protein [Pseudomonadota bacterium]